MTVKSAGKTRTHYNGAQKLWFWVILALTASWEKLHKILTNHIAQNYHFYLEHLFLPGSARIADHTMQVVHSWRQLQGDGTGESSSPYWTYWNIKTHVSMIAFTVLQLQNTRQREVITRWIVTVTREMKGIEMTTLTQRRHAWSRTKKKQFSFSFLRNF